MPYIGAGLTRFNTADELTVTGDATLNGNANLGDNGKAQFGASQDLQIFHNASASYITDQGTGNLVLGGDAAILLQNSAHSANMLDAYNGGRVGLYHAGTLKAETTSSGIDVTGSGDQADVTLTDGSRHKFIGSDANNLQLGTYSSSNTSRDVHMTIDSNGNVGIGQSSPAALFHTEGGNAAAPIGRFKATNTSYGNDVVQIICSRDGATSQFNMLTVFDNNSDLKMLIRPDGDLENSNNSYGVLSDQRYKENIVDAASQWDDIKALQIRKFNLIGDGLTQIGVVAQELETAGLSGLVYDAPEYGTDDAGEITTLESTRKGVKTSVLYMKAVKALQEAMTRIETLETQRADLEARVTALENA